MCEYMYLALTNGVVCFCSGVDCVVFNVHVGDTHHTDRASFTTTSRWRRRMNEMNAASFDSNIIIKYHWHYISCMLCSLLITRYSLFSALGSHEKKYETRATAWGKNPPTIINIQHG